MKILTSTLKSALFVLLLFGTAQNAVSQVTIGYGTAPQAGAILDLNTRTIHGYQGGLLLPNVVITDLGKIPATFTSAGRIACLDYAPELAGLIVFNSIPNTPARIERGVYMWDGDNWRLLAVDTEMMTIPATTPGFGTNPPIEEDAEGRSSTGEIAISNPSLGDYVGQYFFTKIVGADFSSVTVIDDVKGVFSVEFYTNPTAYPRSSVVLVTDPLGRTGTFVFTQAGARCIEPALTVQVGVHGNQGVPAGTARLCAGGSVHAYVIGANPEVTYFWVRNGIEVAQGAGAELTQTGTYRVYARMIGCGTPGIIEVVASPNQASRAPHIIVSNNGILCGTNPVTLSAINVPNPSGLVWLHEGLRHAAGNNQSSITVSGEASQGTWYLIHTTPDGCSSVSSNKINLAFTEGNSGLPQPDARINGTPISASEITVCAGGTLRLSIENAAAFSTFYNVEFEWFGNGQSLGKTTASTMYVVPPSFENLVLSVTVTATGLCPVSATSNNFTVRTGQTPVPVSINRGDARAYICALQPAVLTAGTYRGAGYVYQWYRNGQIVVGAVQYQHSAMQAGTYTVRYQNPAGCWSIVSSPIEVVQSAPVSISWIVSPNPAEYEIFNSSKTFSVAIAPAADKVEWSVVNPAHADFISFIPLGAGNAAIVNFGSRPDEVTDVQIKVSASNTCGTTELISPLFTVRPGCIAAGAVVITPSTAQTMEQRQSITFTASANVGSAPMLYRWYVDGVLANVSSSSTFTFTPAAARPGNPYRIHATVASNCDPASPIISAPASSVSVPVNVNINPRILPRPSAAFEAHFFGGKTCLDVHLTDGNATDNPWADGGRLPLTRRPNDFNNGNQLNFTYTFSTVGGSNIRFMVDDPMNIVQSVSGDANANRAIATVTFNPNIRTMAAQTTRNTALEFTLYAVFDAAGGPFQENIVIRVQDQPCGCPARVSTTQWQMFQCHNIGANESVNPMLHTAANREAIRGHWFQWGRKTPARLANGNLSASTPASVPGGDWTSWNDPCPPGWRVATETTWRAVFANNTPSVTAGFWNLGPYLHLPGQGYMASATSAITDPAGRHYWTRTRTTTAAARNFYRHGTITATVEVWGSISIAFAEPIRCVQEGTPFAEND